MIYNFEIKGQLNADNYQDVVDILINRISNEHDVWIHTINIKEWINQADVQPNNATTYKHVYTEPLKKDGTL